MSTETTTSQTGFKKVLSGLDITLLTICAILGLDTLAPMASSGPAAISWLLITIVLFMVPYGLITAELSSTYPEQGGIYNWVRRGLGPSWAARTSWLYWINNAIWMPSVFIVFASILSQLFFPGLGLWPQIGIAVVMTWVVVLLTIIPLQKSKYISTIGGIVKALVMLLIGVGGVLFGLRNGVANELTITSMLPSWNVGLVFLPIIVYNFIGFDLIFTAGAEIHRPERNNPRAILISGIVVTVVYLVGTIGMLMALPASELGVLESLIDTLRVIFGQTAIAPVLVILVGITVLYSLFALIFVWILGSNRSIAQAAARGDMPAFFGKMHPVHNTPLNASWLTGVISTVAIILYGLLAGVSAQELFSTFFDLSSVAMLLAYLMLFLSYAELRRTDPNTPRPFKAPVGYAGAILLSAVTFLFILQALVFFVWTPGQTIDWVYTGTVIGGSIAVLVIGELLIRKARNKNI